MNIIMGPGGSIREQPKDWWPFRAWRSCLTFQCNRTSEAETVQHYLIHSCSDMTKHCCTPAQVSLWAQEQVWQREGNKNKIRSHSEGQICISLVSHLQISPFISQKLISQAVTWIWTRWEKFILHSFWQGLNRPRALDSLYHFFTS